MKCLSWIWSTGSSHTENHRPVTRRGSCCSLEGDTPPQLPTFALLILTWSAGLSSSGNPLGSPPQAPRPDPAPLPCAPAAPAPLINCCSRPPGWPELAPPSQPLRGPTHLPPTSHGSRHLLLWEPHRIPTRCPHHWSGQRGHSGHCPWALLGWLVLLLLGVPQSWGPRSRGKGKGSEAGRPEEVRPPGPLEDGGGQEGVLQGCLQVNSKLQKQDRVRWVERRG